MSVSDYVTSSGNRVDELGKIWNKVVVAAEIRTDSQSKVLTATTTLSALLKQSLDDPKPISLEPAYLVRGLFNDAFS